ncbi:MAG: TIGR03435 family protein [Acidobacteria bacterium]|nr:TIGR03435 family protein [Acidobacteriota bacterium]
MAAATVLTMAGPAALGIVAQTEKPLAFEVASIKPVPPPPPGKYFFRIPSSATDGISGNRFTIRMVSLRDLIATAHNVQDFQISETPPWASGASPDRYNIEAKGEGDAPLTTPHVRLMLQSLLADRFQLRLHHGTKELPVYNLVAGKNGSKLKEVSPGTKPPTAAGGGTLTRATLSAIIQLIGAGLDRPVVDKTGLPDALYEFPWDGSELIQEIRTAGKPAPSIFSMVQDQLGLKLEARTGPVVILVIDSAEKPSAN